MVKEDKIFVIGDSHVRAFSFDEYFVPLFIGPAIFNNFLTKQNADKVTQKILELLKNNLNEKLNLLLLFSGDVEHIIRKSDGYLQAEIDHLNESAFRYLHCIATLKEKLPRATICISSVLPGRTELYSKYQDIYNSVLKKYCDEKNLSFIDINSRITDDKKIIRSPYKADFAHISYLATNYYLDNLIENRILSSQKKSNISNYKWSHVYNIETSVGPFKIWGGIYKDQLIIRDYETLPLDKLQQSSIQQIQFIKKISEICLTSIHEYQITVANCQEGFVAFELMKINNFKINAWDFESGKIDNAKLIGSLGNNGEVDFLSISTKNMVFDFRNVVVDFEQYKFKEEVRIEILFEIRKQSSYLFLLSENIKSDTRLLNKIGFEYIYDLSNEGCDKRLILASKVLLNRYQNILKTNDENMKQSLFHRIKNKLLE